MPSFTEAELGQARDLLLDAQQERGPDPRHCDAKAALTRHLLDGLVQIATTYGFEAGASEERWHFQRVPGGPVLHMVIDAHGEIAGTVHPPEGEVRTVRPGADLVYDPGRNTWLGPASKTHSVPGRPLVRFTALEHLVRTSIALTRP